MDKEEYKKVLRQAECLKSLMDRYSGKSLDNVLSGLIRRIELYEKDNNVEHKFSRNEQKNF